MTSEPTDDRIVGDAIRAVDDARERAPRDFLAALAGALGVAAAILLIAGAMATGAVHDVLLNLAAEVCGTLLTVVVIDGWWRRRQTAATTTLDRLQSLLRRAEREPLGDTERGALIAFVADYQALIRRESLVDRIHALTGYRNRARGIEQRANRALEQAGEAGRPRT
jgi:hypothetical protein